jgi:SpoVK/Ycf46/Vps4 family AAA+-type ATPase
LTEAQSIKEWFLRARENKPCVLFFDEVDSLAIARDVRAANDHGVLTQLLVEMDGMTFSRRWTGLSPRSAPTPWPTSAR